MITRWQEFFTSKQLSDGERTSLVRAFVRESNGIEGIHRTPSRTEMAAHITLLMKDAITIDDLEQFVRAVQPGAVLRDRHGLNVTVGNHVPPPGGQAIVYALGEILIAIRETDPCPFSIHQTYLDLHPFTDGNGRSSRALWLWMYGPKGLGLPFLQRWYYETLSRGRLR